jgi:hypothetical protein
LVGAAENDGASKQSIVMPTMTNGILDFMVRTPSFGESVLWSKEVDDRHTAPSSLHAAPDRWPVPIRDDGMAS